MGSSNQSNCNSNNSRNKRGAHTGELINLRSSVLSASHSSPHPDSLPPQEIALYLYCAEETDQLYAIFPRLQSQLSSGEEQ